MASTQSDTGYPDDYVHVHVQYLLGWNPQKLEVDLGPATTHNMSSASTNDYPWSN